MKKIPGIFKEKIGFGVYGGAEQYYIIEVDGSLAQLGDKLPKEDKLKKIIEKAEKEHTILIKNKS